MTSGELGLPDELLLGLDRERTEPGEALKHLIDLVVTQSGEKDHAPTSDSWRWLIVISDKSRAIWRP